MGRVNGSPSRRRCTTPSTRRWPSRFANQSGDITAAQQEMIRDQAWENIVSNIITGEQVKKLGITVTDEEVLNFLKTSPPSEVQQYFKDKSGNFDYAAYQAALNNPDADWTAVEALARERIPIVKLNHYLMSQVHVSATEVRQASRRAKHEARGALCAVPARRGGHRGVCAFGRRGEGVLRCASRDVQGRGTRRRRILFAYPSRRRNRTAPIS